MNLFTFFKNSLRYVSAVFIFLMVIGISYNPVTTPRTDAFVDNIIGEMGAWLQTGYTTIMTTASKALDLVRNNKELVLDPLVWQMINLLLQQMMRDMITWINSGFQGDPAFVQNFDGFLTGVADNVVGNFIWRSEDLKFLCSPFKLNIKLALEFQYKQTRNFKSQCTLTSTVKNVDQFLKGNFLQGGWNGWFSVVTVPMNNPYGALMEAQGVMDARISTSQSQQKTKLDWGKGLFSQELCYDDEAGHHCDTVTPGTAIEAQLNNTLDSGQRRLHVADEFNEMFSALLSQLALQAFNAAKGGLLGMSQAKVPGAQSTNSDYFSKIGGSGDIMIGKVDVDDPMSMKAQIVIETNYRDALQPLITSINNAATYKDRVYGATNQCHSGALPRTLSDMRASVNAKLTVAQQTVTLLTTLSADYDAITANPVDTATLEALYTKYGVATKPEVENEIQSLYGSLLRSLHDETSADRIARDETYDPSKIKIDELIETFTRAVDNACQDTSGGGGYAP